QYIKYYLLFRMTDMTSELEEERRQSKKRREMIDELAAKIAQFEKNQTIFGGMITNIGIPDDSFPTEILTQPVELHMFPATTIAEDCEERNDDGEELIE
ncbi:hypothetical protein PMAYCL1PPCAC_20711, partial [Pristionchus mayeri]